MKTGLTMITIMAFLLPLLMFLLFSNNFIILTWDILNSPSLPISLSLMLDTNGMLLMVTVLFIASNVMFFTTSYMAEDKFLPRFISLVVSFVFAMSLLILIPNIITILIGWDGLGLSSYLLVLYYQTPKSQGAAMITAMTNRLGDVFILFTISWSINTHWLPLSPWSCPSHFLLSTMLIIAAMTKSAQYPFISWLPAAMAAPTPVSALVHSSTLVTAGVFILIRFFNSLKGYQFLEFCLLFVACITTLLAGLSALSECDMKKIIALSTLSQLGTMMFSLSMEVPQITLFHLITHALFKALLFVTAGILIHYHHHTQDLRSYGLLNKSFPVFSSMIIVSSFALAGMPFTAGFYSKDLIIETMVSSPVSYLLIMLFILATSLTSMYSVRFITNVSWAPRNTPPLSPFQPSMNITIMTPMFFLSQGTLFIGSSLVWTLIFPAMESTLPIELKLQAMYALMVGSICGIFISTPTKMKAAMLRFTKLNEFLTSLAFSTPINSQFMAQIPNSLGHSCQKSLEGGWVEIMGGQGTKLSLTPLSNILNMSLGKSLSINFIMMGMFSIICLLFLT